MVSRERLPQNFLTNELLVKSLLEETSIGPNDYVLDIGAGQGIITDQLLQRAKGVFAVEVDPSLIAYLRRKYDGNENVTVVEGNILEMPLPDFPYKIFSNIPFSIEGELFRKLIEADTPPEEAYLFLRSEYARRLAGVPFESQFHITYSPWFEIEIFRHIDRDNFYPRPKVEVDILRFKPRKKPLIGEEWRDRYTLFIRQGFNAGPNLKSSLTPSPLSYMQLSRLSHELEFYIKDRPRQLTFAQWIGLFEFFQKSGNEQIERFFEKFRRYS